MSIRLDSRNPQTNSDGLITIEGVPGYFSKFSGIKIKTTRPKYSDGLTTIVRNAGSGTTNYEDVTLERSFDPEIDGSLLDWCEKARVSIDGADITARPVKRNANGVEDRGTRAWRLSGCRLASLDTFDIDTGSGDAVVMVVITFTVEQASFS